MNNHIIKLSCPAQNWEQATALGGGSFGAMCFGSPHTEKIYLTEETIWSGEKRDTTSIKFKENIDIMRKMYLDGKISEIDDFAKKNMTNDCISTINSFEYAGILEIDYKDKGEITNYSRVLDLDDATMTVTYKNGEKTVEESAFCSFRDETTVVSLYCAEKISISARYQREHIESVTFLNDLLLVRATTADKKHKFAVAIKVITDGDWYFEDGKIEIEDAEYIDFFIATATEFNFGNEFEAACLDILSEIENEDSAEDIKDTHLRDYKELFSRSDISFYSDETIKKLPVDERLKRLKEDENAKDDDLFALYFAFSKYLLISSSREDTLPANLQGVWVEKLQNPWNSDYHTNINLQMNYWLGEVANLSECTMPLFDYMNNYLLQSGKKTAEVNYGCRGTVLHHLSDIYGFTTPADGVWGIWPMGAAWLSLQMWEHYLYTKDEEFLRNDAYEYIHECMLFFKDYLFEDENGLLISGPSMSPENEYYPKKDDRENPAYIAFSPTMDTEIISCLLRNYIETEKILCINEKDKKDAQEMLSKMPPLKIGANGCLQEWLYDYEEKEPGHRHISHAFALYPDCYINESTPELFESIKNTIERRLSFGSGHTGWSRAWLINLFARLKDGQKTYDHIRLLLTKSTLYNLFDVHPPFQIDGNFGGGAGIAESLLQSHEDVISILPAVKSTLSGSFKKLKARGNIEVSADFTNAFVTTLKLCSEFSQQVDVKVNGKIYPVKLNENETYEMNFS